MINKSCKNKLCKMPAFIGKVNAGKRTKKKNL